MDLIARNIDATEIIDANISKNKEIDLTDIYIKKTSDQQNSILNQENVNLSNKTIILVDNLNEDVNVQIINLCSSSDSQNSKETVNNKLKRHKISIAYDLIHTFDDYKLYGPLLSEKLCAKYFGVDYLPLSNDRLIIQIGDCYGDNVFLFVDDKKENRDDLIYFFVTYESLNEYIKGNYKYKLIFTFIL